MVNWTPVVVGIVVTIVLAFIGIFVPFLSIIAPIIGGIVAAYMGGGDYTDGAVNGGIAGGVGFLIVFGLIFTLFGAIGGFIFGSVGLGAVTGGIIGAVLGFIVGLILGIIGGVIGIAIKGKPEEMKEPVIKEEPVEKPTEEPLIEEETAEEPTPARESPNITFLENIQKCICTTCPVQAESKCAKEKAIKMQEIMQKMAESEEITMPAPEDVPGMYCATGKATCNDIDPSKECQCANCLIWEENDLENGQPIGVFCRDGKAV